MNALLLTLLITGPFRALAPLEAHDTRPAINSLNAITGDHWLELPASRPARCDGPCAETAAPVPSVECEDLVQRVTRAQAAFREIRATALAVGQALEENFPFAEEQYARLGLQMAVARAILTEAELSPTWAVTRTWKLAAGELLPGFPATWSNQGSAFRVLRKTGRILDDHPLDLEISTEGATVVVRAKMMVAPVEYCAGDISYRIEGEAAYQAMVPLATSVALTANALPLADQAVTLPGDL